MAQTLSEKLGLEPSGNVADPFDYSPAGVAAAIEADRRATVEAVARWLREEWWDHCAAHVRRELLSPSPGEGRPEAGHGGGG